MKKGSISEGRTSSRTYEVLQGIVREKVQGFIRDILEEEVPESLDEGNRSGNGSELSGSFSEIQLPLHPHISLSVTA